MSNLSQIESARIVRLLDERERLLLEDVRREEGLKDAYAEVASEAPDTGDSSFADLSTDLGNAAIARDVIELRAIGRARDRLQNGSYGICVGCEEPIPFERLLAQPAAERCAACQEAWERTHAGSGRGATL